MNNHLISVLYANQFLLITKLFSFEKNFWG